MGWGEPHEPGPDARRPPNGGRQTELSLTLAEIRRIYRFAPKRWSVHVDFSTGLFQLGNPDHVVIDHDRIDEFAITNERGPVLTFVEGRLTFEQPELNHMIQANEAVHVLLARIDELEQEARRRDQTVDL